MLDISNANKTALLTADPCPTDMFINFKVIGNLFRIND